MATTYEPIATTTLGSAQSTVDFSSISGSYTDIVVVGNLGISTASENVLFRVGNGSIDTGSNYSSTELYGTGSSAGSQRTSSATGARISFAGSFNTAVDGNFILHLMNYANTTTYKSFLSRFNSTAATYPATAAYASLWRSTSAINTLRFYTTGGNFLANSTFTLYGIAAA